MNIGFSSGVAVQLSSIRIQERALEVIQAGISSTLKWRNSGHKMTQQEISSQLTLAIILQIMKCLEISFHSFHLRIMPSKLVGYCQDQTFSTPLSGGYHDYQ